MKRQLGTCPSVNGFSHNIFYNVERFYLDDDLMNLAFYDDPELLNNDPDGIDDPDFYKVENGSLKEIF